MALTPRNRPSHKLPAPGYKLIHHPCPLCKTQVEIPVENAYIEAGDLNAVVIYDCPGCREPRRTQLTLSLYAKLSEAFCRIDLQVEEMTDPLRNEKNRSHSTLAHELKCTTALTLSATDHAIGEWIEWYRSTHTF